MSPPGFSGLPSDMGRATLVTSVYATLQLLRRTARYVAIPAGGLLPRLLTLAPARRSGGGRLFSSALLCPRGHLPLGSRTLCVARTFLCSDPYGYGAAASRPTAYCGAKIAQGRQMAKRFAENNPKSVIRVRMITTSIFEQMCSRVEGGVGLHCTRETGTQMPKRKFVCA